MTRRLPLVLATIVLAGCLPQGHISVASGDNQIGSPGATLAPLVVTVTDAKGAAASGVPITFTIASGSGSLGQALVKTDALGHAQTTLALGGAGTVLVNASAPQAGAPVRFSETALGVSAGVFSLLDAFESPGAPAPWTFGSDGGARGALTSGPGLTGKGAHLTYDFTGGGSWTAANLTLATPVVAALVAFEVRSDPGIRIHLRVVDGSGQELEYALARPLEAIDPAAFYRHVVELDAPSGYHGGANDGVVHGALTKIAIVAADAIERGARGAIDLDDVGTIDSKVLDLDLNTVVKAPAGGVTQELGVEIHFLQDDKALDAAKAAGFSLVRMDLAWDWIEKTAGVYDFSGFDALVASLDARGMKALFILDYGNKLHEDGPGWAPRSAATIAAFGNYVEAAARHFAGRGVRYEVWNEPNLPIYWKPSADPAGYARVCQEAITRVHLGDPLAEVSTGGLSGFDFGFLRGVGAQGAQAVGVHPYRKGSPETASDELLLWRAIAGNTWATEWGYNADDLKDDQKHGRWVVRELLSLKALGVPVAVYYEIRDDSSGRFGILDASYGDKPASVALKTLAGQTAGRTFAGFLGGGPSSLHALRLDGAQDKVVVLWSDVVGGGVSVTVPAGSTAVDCFGAVVTPVVVGARVAFPVSEAAGPIYVRVP